MVLRVGEKPSSSSSSSSSGSSSSCTAAVFRRLQADAEKAYLILLRVVRVKGTAIVPPFTPSLLRVALLLLALLA